MLKAGITMVDRQEVKSLKKALRVLNVMNEKGDATISEVAAAVGVPRTTAFRLLETLATEGYVSRQPHSPYYRLASEVLALSRGLQSENMLLEIARPLLTELGGRIGWGVSLATPRDSNMIVRITTAFDTTLELDRFMVGQGVPLMRATTGLCYLAFCTDVEREARIGMARASGDPLQSLSHQRDKLDVALQRVRRRRFCNLEFASSREGSVGVPVLVDGTPFGGISMRYIKAGMTSARLVDEFIPQLAEVSARITDEYALCNSHKLWNADIPAGMPETARPPVLVG
jgi:IclR family mhp operon transcriptional activator